MVRKTDQTESKRYDTQDRSKSHALAHIPHVEHVQGCPDTSPADSDAKQQELATLRIRNIVVGVYVYGATVRLNAVK